MSCQRCGQPCDGRLCRACAMDRANEKRDGVPADHINNCEEDGDE